MKEIQQVQAIKQEGPLLRVVPTRTVQIKKIGLAEFKRAAAVIKKMQRGVILGDKLFVEG